MSTPRISRCPSAFTPVATSTWVLTTRPPSRTFPHGIVNASAARNVYGPASRGRVRKSSTWASNSLAITDTWDFDSRVMPRVSTSFSIRRVDTWRFHAFFTTTDADVLDTIAADKTHRHHAVIEQVHADLKGAALAHLPSGVFTANAAWLVLAVIAFNLTRAAASLTDPQIAKATTATIRRKLITVPARVATSARRVTLHLPQAWPWENAWTALFDRVSDPPQVLAA